MKKNMFSGRDSVVNAKSTMQYDLQGPPPKFSRDSKESSILQLCVVGLVKAEYKRIAAVAWKYGVSRV